MGRPGGRRDLSPLLWHLKGPHSSLLVCATPAIGHTAPAPPSCSQACERSEVGEGRGPPWLQVAGSAALHLCLAGPQGLGSMSAGPTLVSVERGWSLGSHC